MIKYLKITRIRRNQIDFDHAPTPGKIDRLPEVIIQTNGGICALYEFYKGHTIGSQTWTQRPNNE